jgi:hypothetical protein
MKRAVRFVVVAALWAGAHVGCRLSAALPGLSGSLDSGVALGAGATDALRVYALPVLLVLGGLLAVVLAVRRWTTAPADPATH